jgi:hypothetical protein
MNLDRVLVCTIATHETMGFADLKKSCEKFHIPLVFFGWGQEYRGASWRLKILYEQLLERERDYDYVLLVDGFDTVFATGLRDIMRTYASMKTRFLMSAETNCWPPVDPGPQDYPPAPTRYRYVNSGGYICKMDYLIHVMTELGVTSLPDYRSDQQFWAGVYVWGKTEMKLDYYCQVFQCLFDAQDDLTFERKIFNHTTGSTPFIIHGNGRTDMTRVKQFVLDDRSRIVKIVSFLVSKYWKRPLSG